MKVMKFGGSSVGTANSILSVKRIVEAVNEPVIVVVSALGGITDKLINTSKMAAAGDASYENEFREIVYRHVEMIKEVIPAGEAQVALQRQVGELLNELKDIFQGIYLIKDLSQKTSDTIVSYGAVSYTHLEWKDLKGNASQQPVNNLTHMSVIPVGMWFNKMQANEYRFVAYWRWDKKNDTLSDQALFFNGEENGFVSSPSRVTDKTYYKGLCIRCVKE